MYREAASWGSVENPPEFLKMFESNPPDGPTIAASLLAADWNWFISRRRVSISPTDRVCPCPSFANMSPSCGIFGLVFRRRRYCHVPGPLVLGQHILAVVFRLLEICLFHDSYLVSRAKRATKVRTTPKAITAR